VKPRGSLLAIPLLVLALLVGCEPSSSVQASAPPTTKVEADPQPYLDFVRQHAEANALGAWLAGIELANTKAYLEAVHAENLRVAAERRAAARAAAAAAEASKSSYSAAGASVDLPAGEMPAILYRIRGCESGNGPNSPGSYTAKNPNSSASGAYQFLDSTWRSVTGTPPPARAYSPAEQDAAALALYNSSGTSPWNASRYCWG
jgi:hypothetical protein